MTTKITINKIETEKLIKAYFRKSTMRSDHANKMKKDIRSVLKMIEAQIQTGDYRLDLSDTRFKEELNLNPKRSKTMRMVMKEMGLIFFPEFSRSRKPGDYPWWMIDFNFTEIEYVDEVTKEKKKINFFPAKYDAEFHKITRKIITDLLSYECPPRGIDFVVAVYNNRSEMLERIGKVKEDFLV